MTSVDSTLPSALASLGVSQTEEKKDRSKLGQDEFLKLMVAQLRNQDPFKPMENGDFIAQMAQFSSVTGIDKLQQSFTAFSTSMQSNQALQASTMVGREVLIESNQIAIESGGSASGTLEIPNNASNVRVGILSASGELVRNIFLGDRPTGNAQFTWDGLNEDGNPLPPGTYQVAAMAGQGEQSYSLKTMVNAHVDSVSLNQQNRSVTLNLKDLGSVSMTDVVEIR